MFEHRTVIVIGAGASKECNLPIGRELALRIAPLLDIRFPDGYRQTSGDPLICAALKHFVRDHPSRINDYLRAGWRIRDAMPQAISIDNFIDSHRGDEEIALCGKLAIVRAILDAEGQSALALGTKGDQLHPDFTKLGETWYSAFMQLLTENCRKEELPERLSNITFVVFNYDRCVEHFIYHGIQNYYTINPSEAAAILQNLHIFHPYGAVGELPWNKRAPSIDFGGKASTELMLDLANNIKTFTEGTDPESSDIYAIRQHIQKAGVVLFLGFAFHKLNLRLLKPGSLHDEPTKVRYFGTAFGMSHSDRDMIISELADLAGARIERVVLRNDLACGPFFREYWRSLSLG